MRVARAAKGISQEALADEAYSTIADGVDGQISSRRVQHCTLRRRLLTIGPERGDGRGCYWLQAMLHWFCPELLGVAFIVPLP